MKLIAKLITALTLMAYSMGAWANINGQYSVLLKFSSGEQVQYNKIPGDTQVEALVFRIMQDFPQYDLQRDLVDAQVVQTGQSATPQPIHRQTNPAMVQTVHKPQTEQDVPFWDTGWGTVAKVAITAVVIAGLVKAFGGAGVAGAKKANPCDYSWQLDSRGHQCGGRAAFLKPGGR